MPNIPTADSVLVVVDVQYDFLPGGRLAVAGGNEIIPVINALGQRFANIVLTQDWHPADHVSFASMHPGRQPFELIDVDYGRQVLWPDHCVQGTEGAELSRDLDLPHAQLVIRKGFRREIDSYSAFAEADRTTRTGLEGYLRERELTRLFVVGLATDFCVNWTAVDARAAGFETTVIADACRAIDADGTLEAAWDAMNAAGVRQITSAELG